MTNKKITIDEAKDILLDLDYMTNLDLDNHIKVFDKKYTGFKDTPVFDLADFNGSLSDLIHKISDTVSEIHGHQLDLLKDIFKFHDLIVVSDTIDSYYDNYVSTMIYYRQPLTLVEKRNILEKHINKLINKLSKKKVKNAI